MRDRLQALLTSPVITIPLRVVGRARVRTRQWLCGWTGHETYAQRAGRTVTLRCVVCGYQTPGWTITGTVRRRFAGDEDRHRLQVQERG